MSENSRNNNDRFITDLVVSRLVHEVIGPIGAMSNGVELVQEFGGGDDPEVLKLISDSAAETSSRLQFYRTAYGRSGYDICDLAQLRGVTSDFFAGSTHHELVWPLPPILPRIPPGLGRVILVVTEIAKDCLGHGGAVIVNVTDVDASIIASNSDVCVSEAVVRILDGDNSELTPREAHVALAVQFCGGIGMTLTHDKQDGQVQFFVRADVD